MIFEQEIGRVVELVGIVFGSVGVPLFLVYDFVALKKNSTKLMKLLKAILLHLTEPLLPALVGEWMHAVTKG